MSVFSQEFSFFHDAGFTAWGPEAALRLEGTRWLGTFGLTGAIQAGGMHLIGDGNWFAEHPVLPTVSLELGVAF